MCKTFRAILPNLHFSGSDAETLRITVTKDELWKDFVCLYTDAVTKQFFPPGRLFRHGESFLDVHEVLLPDDGPGVVRY